MVLRDVVTSMNQAIFLVKTQVVRIVCVSGRDQFQLRLSSLILVEPLTLMRDIP